MERKAWSSAVMNFKCYLVKYLSSSFLTPATDATFDAKHILLHRKTHMTVSHSRHLPLFRHRLNPPRQTVLSGYRGNIKNAHQKNPQKKPHKIKILFATLERQSPSLHSNRCKAKHTKYNLARLLTRCCCVSTHGWIIPSQGSLNTVASDSSHDC